MLQVYDTRSATKAPFRPREDGKVAMYACGPTVYDHPHLGHARSAITYDVIRRYLAWRGYEVTFVMNVTDIDDKIIARAAEEGSTEPEIAARYEKSYFELMARVGVREPDHRPHATEYIQPMHQVIQALIDKDAAYEISGQGIYFDVGAHDRYGDLAHRSRQVLEEGAGARVEVDERKRSPLDFVLWKAAKPGEPTWDSPWGPGRPGWHTECVAMSLDILGDGFDIHGGGDDLVFPHHQNELAQAEVAGHEFSRYWVHNGMINVEGVKMSKSLGNFTTLKDALEHYDPRAIRLITLQSHYRRTMEVDAENMTAVERALDRFDALARRLAGAGLEPGPDLDGDAVQEFQAAMDDDFTTPRAVAVVFSQVSAANSALDAGDLDGARRASATAFELARVLGLSPAEPATGDDDAEINDLVQQREAARSARDFAGADRIRDELAARGVRVEDTANGPVWHREAG